MKGGERQAQIEYGGKLRYVYTTAHANCLLWTPLFSVRQGPDFNQLEEDIQNAWMMYIRKDCGVDEDLVVFIVWYSIVKEEMCYVQWLKEIQDILK